MSVDTVRITVISRADPSKTLRAEAYLTSTEGPLHRLSTYWGAQRMFRWSTDWGASGLEEVKDEHLTWILDWPETDSPEVHALQAAYALAPALRLP